jgi:hypothetical protein
VVLTVGPFRLKGRGMRMGRWAAALWGICGGGLRGHGYYDGGPGRVGSGEGVKWGAIRPLARAW